MSNKAAVIACSVLISQIDPDRACLNVMTEPRTPRGPQNRTTNSSRKVDSLPCTKVWQAPGVPVKDAYAFWLVGVRIANSSVIISHSSFIRMQSSNSVSHP